MKLALDAGMLIQLASNLPAPTFIAVDETSVYWTDGSGFVLKLTPK
jgi:hypothetical protein